MLDLLKEKLAQLKDAIFGDLNKALKENVERDAKGNMVIDPSKIKRYPETDKPTKSYSAQPTKSVRGVYNTSSTGYAKGGEAVPETKGKVQPILGKNEVDDIKRKYAEPHEPTEEDTVKRKKLLAEPHKEPSMEDRIADLKAKYGVTPDKTKTFQEKVDEIKRKHKQD